MKWSISFLKHLTMVVVNEDFSKEDPVSIVVLPTVGQSLKLLYILKLKVTHSIIDARGGGNGY